MTLENQEPSEAVPEDSCNACGSHDAESLFTASDRLYHTTGDRFQVAQCKQCGLIRLSPQPSPAELKKYYPENYWFVPHATTAGRIEETYRRFVLRDHIRFVGKALRDSQETGPILDVGCGGGLFLRMMHERGFRVMGLDFSQGAATIARTLNGVPAVCASLSEAPFPSQSCSAVTMFHVLEHLYDPRSYLRAAHNLLKPGGKLIVQVPNAACWQFVLLGESWNGVDVPRHLYNFRAQDLEALLVSCGFEVLRRKYFSLRDNPAGLATSLAPALDPMARRLRGVAEGSRGRLARDLLYGAIVLAALPFTAIEAACGAGSTIMMEARKKPPA